MASAYEYDVDCQTCGLTYRIALLVPAEAIERASLGRLVTSLHPVPLCKPLPPAPCTGTLTDDRGVWSCTLPAGHPTQHAAVLPSSVVEAVWFP